MSKIVMFSHKPVFKNGMTSGPGIRIYEIAKALQKKGHEITIYEKNSKKEHKKEDIDFVPWIEEFDNDINSMFDLAIINIWCNGMEFLETITIPIIADISTPNLFEAEVYFSHSYKEIVPHQENKYVEDILLPTMNVFERADIFICASERQKWYYYGILQSIGRLGPYNNGEDIIKIVPFGITKQPKTKPKNILKKIKGLRNKKIILWPGAIFPWFDAITPIKAIANIVKTNKKVALVFVGTNNPFAPRPFIYKNFKKAEKLAEEKGILNKNVFFIDWVKLEDKNSIYADSEIVLITHKKNLETDFSFRTRTIDALESNKPIICTQGDSVSEKISKEKAGLVVPPENEEELKRSIEKLLYDKKLQTKLISKTKLITNLLFWDSITEEINDFCQKPKKKLNKMHFSPYDIIKEKDKVIIQNNVNNDQLSELFKIINNQKTIIERQVSVIGSFKNSIVYPLFKFTSRFGVTKIGRLLQRILK